MKYGSVCSGIEAATMAWHPLGWQPSFFSEIEGFPRAVLKHHYPDVPLHGDFTTIKKDDYEPIDLLVGGTPCQSFSIAGLRKGLDDDRGNLALEFLKLAKRLRPRWLVWENVPGVLSSNGGRDFAAFLGGLAEVGYGFAYRVLDAQYVRVESHAFAVPQRRRRVFVVGYFGDWRPAAAVLFEREGLQGHSPPSRKARKGIAGSVEVGFESCGSICADSEGLDGQDAYTGRIIPYSFDSLSINSMKSKNPHSGCRPVDVAKTINTTTPDPSKNQGGHAIVTIKTANTKSNGSNINTGGASYTLDGSVNQAIAIQGSMIGRKDTNGPQGSGLDETGVSFTLNTIDRHGVFIPYSPNYLNIQFRKVGDVLAFPSEMSGTQCATSKNVSPALSVSHTVSAAQQTGVRRLTPVECERLQGFPDNFTLIPYGNRKRKGKDLEETIRYLIGHGYSPEEAEKLAHCPDGPRYKALGNSMAVNVMSWIGQRIEMVNNQIKTK